MRIEKVCQFSDGGTQLLLKGFSYGNCDAINSGEASLPAFMGRP